MNHPLVCGLAKNKSLAEHGPETNASSVLEFRLPGRRVEPQKCKKHVGSKGRMEITMSCAGQEGSILPDAVARHGEKREVWGRDAVQRGRMLP